MPEMAREYTRVGGQMETAKKQRTTRLNPRWCSPNMNALINSVWCISEHR